MTRLPNVYLTLISKSLSGSMPILSVCFIFLGTIPLAQARVEEASSLPEVVNRENGSFSESRSVSLAETTDGKESEEKAQELMMRSQMSEEFTVSVAEESTEPETLAMSLEAGESDVSAELEPAAATAVAERDVPESEIALGDRGEVGATSLPELSPEQSVEQSEDPSYLVSALTVDWSSVEGDWDESVFEVTETLPDVGEDLPALDIGSGAPVLAQAVPGIPALPPAMPPAGMPQPTGVMIPWSPYGGVAFDPALAAGTVAPGAGVGTWVMVWLPYGTAMPTVNGATAAVPVGGYSYANSGLPGAVLPVASGPYPAPLAVMAPQPSGVQSAGAVYQPGQVYLPVSPGPQALLVPTAPTSTAGIPALPGPPPGITPVIPPMTYPVLPPFSPAVPVSVAPEALPTTSQTVSPASSVATGLVPEASQGPITEPTLELQGLYILQGDNSSARARLSGSAFLSRYLLVGGALDLVTGPDLTNDDGVQLTELYLAAAVPGVPGLRFRFGQLDLTSYFDRNSFAKDAGRDFLNPTFQTNPALIAGANVTASRPAGLVQWNITDNIAVSSAIFSSDPDIGDFDLNGFAAEASFRTGNLIVRGTFISSEDSEFQGTGDRLESYGLNAEWFIPEANIGLFGRYGELRNTDSGLDASTYSFGVVAFDVLMENDRLGLAYGRNLELDFDDGTNPDVLELLYDFEVIPNIRVGFSLQQRNSLRETFAGFRVRSDLDLTPSISAD